MTFNKLYKLISESANVDDEYYLELAKESDKNKDILQQIIKNAAIKAKYNIGPVYHGTKNAGFTKFKTNQNGRYFFTVKKDYANQYSKDTFFADRSKTNPAIISVFLMLHNPINLEDYMDDLLPDTVGDNVIEWKENGFDGATSMEGGGTFQVFSPNQIKSADPVTYDESGNIIPLSQRFDSSKDDIRY